MREMQMPHNDSGLAIFQGTDNLLLSGICCIQAQEHFLK
jgi:hypothetical protein